MAKIIGMEEVKSGFQLQQEIQQGAKFVMYQYCISIVIISFQRSSDVYYIRPGESAILKGLPFTLLSLVLGWWGIPWGPIYTIMDTVLNFSGGKDVTKEVLASMRSVA
jgi:hypothetical protein